MIHYIINYITKWLYGESYHPIAKNETFVFIPTQPARRLEAQREAAEPRVKSTEHLNQIKNFEFKKNRHYYFKY